MTVSTEIVSTPGICFGKPRIAGTRMRVKDVVYYHYRSGWSIDYISDGFDLTPEQVQAALSYYADHKAEIDADMRADDDYFKAVMESDEYKAQQKRVAQIQAKLDAIKAKPHSQR